MDKEEILNIIKKYVYICGQEENEHLAFKNISVRKHKEEFEKIRTFLEEK